MPDYQKTIFHLSTQKCSSLQSFNNFFTHFDRILNEFKNYKFVPPEVVAQLQEHYFSKLSAWLQSYSFSVQGLVEVAGYGFNFYNFLEQVQPGEEKVFIDDFLGQKINLYNLFRSESVNAHHSLYLEQSIAQALCITNILNHNNLSSNPTFSQIVKTHHSLKLDIKLCRNNVASNLSFENFFLLNVQAPDVELFPYISNNNATILSYILHNTSGGENKARAVIDTITRLDLLEVQHLPILQSFVQQKKYELRAKNASSNQWNSSEIRQLEEYLELMKNKLKLETILPHMHQSSIVHKV